MKKKNIFSNYKKCFFCNSDNLGDSLPFKYIDSSYTLQIRKKNKLSIDDLKKNLLLKICNNCQSFTFSKWFSHEIYRDLYKFSKHNSGWKKFSNTIFNNYPNIIRDDIDTFSSLKNQIKKIESYMEMRCPFMGLFPLFSLIKSRNANEKLFKSKFHRFKIFLLKLKRKKSLNEEILSDFNHIKIPKKNIFLADNSARGWGEGCNNFGNNCKRIISQFNWINYQDLNDFGNAEKYVDLLYINNTLDHIEDPFDTLLKLSLKLKNIYIKFHEIDGGAQHPFFLNKNTIEFIASKLNFQIINFRSGAGINNEYLLSK